MSHLICSLYQILTYNIHIWLLKFDANAIFLIWNVTKEYTKKRMNISQRTNILQSFARREKTTRKIRKNDGENFSNFPRHITTQIALAKNIADIMDSSRIKQIRKFKKQKVPQRTNSITENRDRECSKKRGKSAPIIAILYYNFAHA